MVETVHMCIAQTRDLINMETNTEDELKMEEDSTGSSSLEEDSSDDEFVTEKKKRRRKQNREAAQRCRAKRRQESETVVQDYKKYLSANTAVRHEIKTLEKEKASLEQVLAQHKNKEFCHLRQSQTHSNGHKLLSHDGFKIPALPQRLVKSHNTGAEAIRPDMNIPVRPRGSQYTNVTRTNVHASSMGSAMRHIGSHGEVSKVARSCSGGVSRGSVQRQEALLKIIRKQLSKGKATSTITRPEHSNHFDASMKVTQQSSDVVHSKVINSAPTQNIGILPTVLHLINDDDDEEEEEEGSDEEDVPKHQGPVKESSTPHIKIHQNNIYRDTSSSSSNRSTKSNISILPDSTLDNCSLQSGVTIQDSALHEMNPLVSQQTRSRGHQDMTWLMGNSRNSIEPGSVSVNQHRSPRLGLAVSCMPQENTSCTSTGFQAWPTSQYTTLGNTQQLLGNINSGIGFTGQQHVVGGDDMTYPTFIQPDPTAAPGMPVSVVHDVPVPVAHGMPVSAAHSMPVPVAHGMPVSGAHSMPVPVAHVMPVSGAHGMPVPVAHGMPVPVAHGMPVPVAHGMPVSVAHGMPVSAALDQTLYRYVTTNTAHTRGPDLGTLDMSSLIGLSLNLDDTQFSLPRNTTNMYNIANYEGPTVSNNDDLNPASDDKTIQDLLRGHRGRNT